MIYIYYTHIIHVIKSSSYFKNKLLKYYYICTVHVYVSALCVAGVYLKISLYSGVCVPVLVSSRILKSNHQTTNVCAWCNSFDH